MSPKPSPKPRFFPPIRQLILAIPVIDLRSHVTGDTLLLGRHCQHEAFDVPPLVQIASVHLATVKAGPGRVANFLPHSLRL